MLADLLIANIAFPLRLQIRTRVLAGTLWAQMRGMTLQQLLATGARSVREDELTVRVFVKARTDAREDLADLDARLATARDGGPFDPAVWAMTVPVTGSAERFTAHVLHHVESRWLHAEIDRRSDADRRELAHLADAKLDALLDEIRGCVVRMHRLPQCRHLWVLAQLVHRERQLRRKEGPLTADGRMLVVRACAAFQAEARRELARARVWEAGQGLQAGPWWGEVQGLPEGDARCLVAYRAARAQATAAKAARAARRILHGGSRWAATPRSR